MLRRIFSLSAMTLFILTSNLYAGKVVGVTQFANLTKNKDIEWLGIGIADAITQKLSRIQEFMVVDRTNVERIMKEIALGQSGLVDEKSAKQVGKSLGADIIVIGNYARYGNKLRISARFVEVESHKVLKQVQATGIMDNIFDLQDEIALKLIDESNVSVTEKEKDVIKTEHKVKNITAYEYYSKGQKFYTSAEYKDAIDMFTKAINIDKNFDLAYTGLSKAYANMYWQVWAIFEKDKDESLLTKSYQYAQIALKLNPKSDEAHMSLAKYYQNVDQKKISNKWTLCEQSTRKAIEINPNNAEAYYLLSRIHANDKPKEEQLLLQAIEKNKFLVDAQLQLGIHYYDKKRYDLAESYMKTSITIEPRYVLGYAWLGYLYDQRGQRQKGVDMYESVLKKFPDYVFGRRNLGIIYRELKQYDKAMEQFKIAVRIKPKDYRAWYEMGYIYQEKGNYNEAIRHYNISLRFESNYYYSFANMGYSLSQLGKYADAIPWLRKAHGADTAKAWPAGHLGWIYLYKLNDKANARYWYGEAVRRDPRNTSYQNSLRAAQ